MRTLRRVVSGAAVLAAAAVVLASCGGAAPKASPPPLRPRMVNGNLYLPPAMATAEYTAASGQLSLGPGAVWPKRPFPFTRDGGPQYYQKGFGSQAADFYWFCSWARAAVDPPSPVVESEALGMLPTIEKLPYYLTTLDSIGRGYVSRAVVAAERSRMSLLEMEIRENCPATIYRKS